MHTVWVASIAPTEDEPRYLLGVAETQAGAKQLAQDYLEERGDESQLEWRTESVPSWSPGMGSSGRLVAATHDQLEYEIELAPFVGA